MSEKKYPFGRLMFRVEGKWWNVYFGEGMDDKILVGAILMSFVVDNSAAMNAFMQIFSDKVQSGIEDITGKRPTMQTQTAPEHERSGSA